MDKEAIKLIDEYILKSLIELRHNLKEEIPSLLCNSGKWPHKENGQEEYFMSILPSQSAIGISISIEFVLIPEGGCITADLVINTGKILSELPMLKCSMENIKEQLQKFHEYILSQDSIIISTIKGGQCN